MADCSLVGGDPAEAKRRYAQIAEQHAGTPAAETARFAAARLEKDPARARTLLQDYLRHHPKGRFRAEAEARLKSLK
jgi:outer membrane protein assembly factor BamD (BamD/ComL family)